MSEIENIQKGYYNRISEVYDSYHLNPHALKYRRYCFDKIFGTTDLTGMKVLDAMCGSGQSSAYFIEKGADVTGLDISDRFCELFRKRIRGNHIVCSSILETGFADAFFDIVTITSGLHHLHPHVDKAMDEILRILKPGGYFCCFEPHRNSFADIFRRFWYRIDHRYFEKAERSIDIDRLISHTAGVLTTEKILYGGNVAYLLILNAMILRIPPGLIKYYYAPTMFLERILHRFQGRLLSCWVFLLMKKRG